MFSAFVHIVDNLFQLNTTFHPYFCFSPDWQKQWIFKVSWFIDSWLKGFLNPLVNCVSCSFWQLNSWSKKLFMRFNEFYSLTKTQLKFLYKNLWINSPPRMSAVPNFQLQTCGFCPGHLVQIVLHRMLSFERRNLKYPICRLMEQIQLMNLSPS